MVRKSNIDEIDLKILEMLERDCRRRYTEIARELGISEAAVRKRVKKLTRIGAIKDFKAVIDYNLLGLKEVLVGIDVTPERIVDVARSVKAMRCVKEVFITSGDHDVMVRAVFKGYSELEEFTRELESMEGVVRVCPSILVEEVL